MPSSIALIVYLGFIVYLFRRDLREKPNVTSALWIPLLWMFIIMSRFVSAWLGMFGIHLGGASVEEGSPVDALCSGILIVAGLRVLARRQVQLVEVIQCNRWLTVFFIYCFLAVLWSDYPFVAFKRWIKILGQPIMALILFTEPDFDVALTVLMKRCAYIVIPISVLFIKYFPQWGRGFSEWTGQGYSTGITQDKNALGVDCLIFGFFFVWHLMRVWKLDKDRHRRNELILCAVFLVMIGWLMHCAQSSTSLVTCLVGIGLMGFLSLPQVKKESIGTYLVTGIVVLALAEYLFGISDLFFQLLGRDRTLTDRTLVWQDCLSIPINPLLGVGFESFWLGKRQQMMNDRWYWHPNEAHNGYLETYLNLGLLGLFILAALLLATFWKARREVLTNFDFGRFRLAFLLATLIYNWTESSFKALHPMWFMFYIIALDYRRASPQAEPVSAEVNAEFSVAEPSGVWQR